MSFTNSFLTVISGLRFVLMFNLHQVLSKKSKFYFSVSCYDVFLKGESMQNSEIFWKLLNSLIVVVAVTKVFIEIWISD